MRVDCAICGRESASEICPSCQRGGMIYDEGRVRRETVAPTLDELADLDADDSGDE